jgi:glycosyltransferase involved in cell wall biosynthesis
MKTIAFHDNNLCLRGTTNAMFDYADYNEKILGNKSIIVTSPHGNLDALEKFTNRFGKSNVHLLNFHDYYENLPLLGVDYLYIIKSGNMSDGLCLDNIPTLIHAVFRQNEPHGHKYKYVSDWLAKDQGYDPKDHAVPHMISKLPTPKYNLRERLGISKNKKVFGYLGGSTEFNIRFVQEVVEKIVRERNDIVFLFMNINKFCQDNSNIIHLHGTYDLEEKSAFINACDGMLHARYGGETFGCAVAEFSIENKPVITYRDSSERSHIEILGDRGVYYSTYEEAYDVINNFDSYIKYDDYYRAYDFHSPEKIMERFNKNFLN